MGIPKVSESRALPAIGPPQPESIKPRKLGIELADGPESRLADFGRQFRWRDITGADVFSEESLKAHTVDFSQADLVPLDSHDLYVADIAAELVLATSFWREVVVREVHSELRVEFDRRDERSSFG